MVDNLNPLRESIAETEQADIDLNFETYVSEMSANPASRIDLQTSDFVNKDDKLTNKKKYLCELRAENIKTFHRKF